MQHGLTDSRVDKSHVAVKRTGQTDRREKLLEAPEVNIAAKGNVSSNLELCCVAANSRAKLLLLLSPSYSQSQQC